MNERQSSRELSPTIGLRWLIEHFHLPAAMPATHSRLTAQTGTSILAEGACRQIPRYYLPNGWISHLRFALRYEPIPLDAYLALFRVLDRQPLARWIRAHPQSTSARRAWYLYELLMEEQLDIPDLAGPRYIDLLDPDLHVTGPRRRIPRQHVYDNLLGYRTFSPLVRRTARIADLLEQNLAGQADTVAANCTPSVLAGAVHSIFLKFRVSGDTSAGSGTDDAERLVSVVMRSAGLELTNKEALVRLQNSVVDPKHAETEWRNADGLPDSEEASLAFASANDVGILMNAWMEFLRSVEEVEGFEPVVMAAVAACAFLLIRPFAAGNREMQVLILHHVLSMLRFTSPGRLCSVSAATLRDDEEYVEALNRISTAARPSGSDLKGAMPADWYRYFDATPFVEYVVESIQALVSADLPAAIRFFRTFGPAFRALPEEIATQRAETLVGELLRQNGSLPSAERANYADFPSDCLTRIEKLVWEALHNGYDPQWSF